MGTPAEGEPGTPGERTRAHPQKANRARERRANRAHPGSAHGHTRGAHTGTPRWRGRFGAVKTHMSFPPRMARGESDDINNNNEIIPTTPIISTNNNNNFVCNYISLFAMSKIMDMLYIIMEKRDAIIHWFFPLELNNIQNPMVFSIRTTPIYTESIGFFHSN
jgi:hypothetical protein